MSAPDLNDPSTWTPSTETKSDVFNDAVDLIASTTLIALLYGIALTLYFTCARTLYAQLKNSERRRQAVFMLIYTTVLTICGGLYMVSNCRITQHAYVEQRLFPSGPAAYTLFIFSSPDGILGITTYFIVNWMTDAMLIWRVYVLWSIKRYVWLIITIPCLIYMASFSMSIVIIFESSRPTQSFWSSVAVPFALAYYALTASLTIIATFLMTFRLLIARRQYIQAMGSRDSSHARQYLSIATMIIESSSLYSVWSIIFLGLYIVNNPIQNVFLGTLPDIQIIALLLIIYRVSRGRAWKADTQQVISTMSWKANSAAPENKPTLRSGGGQSTTRFDSLSEAVVIKTVSVDDGKSEA